jgi:haloalkane dehalogenase
VTLVCHDWGDTLGLLLVAQNPDRFRRVVASNTSLRVGGPDLGPGWRIVAEWLQFTQRTEHLRPGLIVDDYSQTNLSPGVRAAYDTPYPPATSSCTESAGSTYSSRSPSRTSRTR